MAILVSAFACLGAAIAVLVAADAIVQRLARRRADNQLPLRHKLDHPYFYWTFAENKKLGTNPDGMWTEAHRKKPAGRYRSTCKPPGCTADSTMDSAGEPGRAP